MHQVSGVADVVHACFQIVPASELPTGRVCRITEVPGRITFSMVDMAHGGGTKDLCAQLNEYCRPILGQARWEQTPPTSPDRIERPSQGLDVARGYFRHVPARRMPAGVACLPLERPGALTWLVHEDHASRQLCLEMNEFLARIVGDGLWLQRWPYSA